MYDEYYGLAGRPFQLTPDQRFFFDSPGHRRALAYLRYGLDQGEGFIVITGGIGTGKTMLVRTLFEELDRHNVMAAQLVTTQVEPDDMLRMVCASFGIAHEGVTKATLLDNLESVARARSAEGKRILLVADEAQNLPARSLEELRMLANFQVGGKSLFQSFLLGQGELRRTLQRPGMEQLRQRIIAAYHLEPLAEEQTRAYIEFRLNRVSWRGAPSLDDGVFGQVFQHTAGVPRRINALCDRLLLYGCIEGKSALTGEDVDVVAEEIREEIGRPAAIASELLASSWESSDVGKDDEGRQTDRSAVGEDALLALRVSALEEGLARLRNTVQHERKLLRKAVLMQLDLDAYDELD